MAKEKIIGRTNETGILTKALHSPDPEFIAVYGRRRVGKTFLIREFFEDTICFEMVGVHQASLKEQLKNFAHSLKSAIGMGILPQAPESWFEAFSILEQFLESPNLNQKTAKRVVFIDELPWFNTPKSGFLPALEHFWNSYGSKKSNLILVVCGSAASWMIQKIVHSKGGLHNRLTRQIRLLPFTLQETEQFLQSRGISLSRYQIISLYMAMGGVPFYLLQAEPGLSSAQILDNICFSKDGVLRNEFERLFASLFDQSVLHTRIVEVLQQKRSGMSRNTLLPAAKIPSGGTASLLLKELEESGFISSAIPYGKKSNEAIYRISDEFTLFYFDWIKPLGKRDAGTGYWMSQQNDPKIRAWAGYTFEGVCLKHIQQIKNALGIGMVETFHVPWYYSPPKNSPEQGAQIDLLIDRKDASVNLCEMKFSESEFTVDADYEKKLRQKKEVFKNVTKTRKTIFTTLITTFGIIGNSHSRDIVSNELTMECLF
ncbi:MAG: ATP-binding protein [Bacteroidetes bacterium]|nr:ATP-binding protein [Bacteroidota bacterium]